MFFEPYKLPEPLEITAVYTARAWLQRGNLLEATKELERLEPKAREHPKALELRCEMFAAEGKWEAVAEVAKVRCEHALCGPDAWVHYAAALHQLKRTREARNVLLRVVECHAGQFLIRYNLARYCCQLGDPEEAWYWFLRALPIASLKRLTTSALSDSDFKPLWPNILKLSAAH